MFETTNQIKWAIFNSKLLNYQRVKPAWNTTPNRRVSRDAFIDTTGEFRGAATTWSWRNRVRREAKKLAIVNVQS